MTNRRNEIAFPGIPNEWILYSGKLVTIRTSNYSDVLNGHVLQAKTDQSSLPIVVVRNDRQSLKSLHEGVRLGDGFLTIESAAETLTRFSKIGRVTGDTTVHALLFLHQKIFQSLHRDTRRILLDTKGHPTADLFDFRDSRKNKDNEVLRKLIFTSFYFWLIEFHQIEPARYPHELVNRNIISRSQLAPMQKLFEKAVATTSDGEMKTLMRQYMFAQSNV